ncbi:hypothetical protein ACIQXR_15855 [Peribacillus sp. NPDC097224]|uniref:hypothetical protein n=1 Tax=Peribacillus sp. NPDC097224 TaxID=3364399 RepID=UPI00381C3207
MSEGMDYLITGILVIAFTCGFAMQLQQLLLLRKHNETIQKRVLYGSYLRCIAYAGFLSTYILNILIGAQLVPNAFFTENNTSLGCILFLLVLVFATLVVGPNKPKRLKKEKL